MYRRREKKREVKGLHTLVQLYPGTSTHRGKWVILKKKKTVRFIN